MIFFRILVLCLVCSMSDLNAFRVTEFNHPQWFNVRYRSYCFSKSESDRIQNAIKYYHTSLRFALGQIPGVVPYVDAICKVLSVAKLVTWWASAKGEKGFSVNIAIKGVGAPYLWESD